ncbi:unnamed protein product [Cuscuta epithymum]|uniref:Uncharacterized protein n=1 Tax=Cuscuta epithymum TaxID=186058 RepID=A0AAV0FFN0_9ASTE|nr:unnamed protein product [Cuscuta epithymum]
MEPSKTYGGDDELGLGWRWEDIFGPSPGNTPAAMEGFENATEPMMQGHEDTTTRATGATEGVEHTPVGNEGTADVKAVDADQGWFVFSSWMLCGLVLKLHKESFFNCRQNSIVCLYYI